MNNCIFVFEMKISSIILSLIVLIQSIGLNFEDIKKLHNLVNDISCHLEQGDTIEDFLIEHYNYNKGSYISKTSLVHHHKHNNNKHGEHGELPFQHDCLNSHVNLVCVFFPTNFNVEILNIVSESENYTYLDINTFLFENSIFQPPRV